MLDFMRVVPGQKLRLQDGQIVEVLENVGDGMWVRGRRVPKSGGTGAASTEEELIHCEEVSAVCSD